MSVKLRKGFVVVVVVVVVVVYFIQSIIAKQYNIIYIIHKTERLKRYS